MGGRKEEDREEGRSADKRGGAASALSLPLYDMSHIQDLDFPPRLPQPIRSPLTHPAHTKSLSHNTRLPPSPS